MVQGLAASFLDADSFHTRDQDLAPKQALSRLSFRWQITLLGALAVILLVAVLFAGLAASRYTKSAVLAAEKRSLFDISRALARDYALRSGIVSTQQSRYLEFPNVPSARTHLTQMTDAVLQKEDSLEAGFYSAAGDSLMGYSFSAGVAPSESQEREVPNAEQIAILKVARAADSTHQPVGDTLNSSSNIVLIAAVPISNGHDYVGCAWTLRRFSTLPGENRFRTYLIAVGLGLAALGCVLLTLLVVRNLQSGVRKIEGGLEALEHDLLSQIATDADPDEIHRIALAINRLGSALNKKIEKEKQIEGQLRHAERLAALGRLIAGVAHEVRNPLATIRLRVQMCQTSGGAGVRQSCAVALEEIERLNCMVSRLLSFSRPVHLHAQPTDLERLVCQRLEYFSELAQRHAIRVVTNCRSHSAAISLDQNRMAQVFDNIIQNAIDAMSERGGTLCVNVTHGESALGKAYEAFVEFNDTGRGMSPEMLGKIFDPFFTTKSSGTGLGLSICHELVQAHGGEIHIVSAEGCGTTVRVALPTMERHSAVVQPV